MIPLIGLTPPHVYVCPKPGSGLQNVTCRGIYFVFNGLRREMVVGIGRIVYSTVSFHNNNG